MFLKNYLFGLKNFDWVLFGSVVLLIFFGLAALYSIAISSDQANFTNFKKQIAAAVIGVVFLFLITFLDYRIWQDYTYLIYLAASFLLVAVLFFGRTISGTTGWFSFPGFSFQPVEIAKVALIIFLSWFLADKIGKPKVTKDFLATIFGVGILFFLIVLQPDFGSAMILFLIWLAMMFFSGIEKKHILISILIFIIIATSAWFFFFQDYQKDRIMTFFNPQADPYGRGYHVRQAVTAVGAGGIFGRGLGFGSQSQLKFIPASQTDFIFAVIAEELGFLGISLITFFWGLIFYRLIKAVKLAKDNFSLLFILGTSALFFSQIVINIGMNMGLVPVTGISLPFLSYGGSFLVISLVLIGIVENMIVINKT